jgi:branched-subunit amino acid transport protein
MSQAWVTILLLAAATYALKSFGPIVLGGDRSLPPRLTRLADELPAPLLAALVAISSFTGETGWTLDARVIGLGAAAIALWRKLPFVVVVIVAAAATAFVRAM